MTKLQPYTCPQQFLNQVEKFLLRNEAQNNLLLGVLYKAKFDSSLIKHMLALFDDNKQINGVAIITASHNGSLILSHNFVKAQIVILNNYLKINRVEIRGIIAENMICDNFINHWQQMSNLKAKLLFRMQILEMRNLNYQSCSDLNLYVAQNEDLDLVYKFCYQFNQEIYPKLTLEEAQLHSKNLAQTFVSNQTGFVLKNNHFEILGFAAIVRQTVNYCAIGLVEVLPERRGFGYGKALVAQLCQYILNNKKWPVLFVDITNQVTMNLYYSIGFKLVTKMNHYCFEQ